ncbi:hypothetical protein [Aquiflexum sp.]|uniref:hypothetical protein n=1 Tax=Aquiflexum sp. TaxID=1872584 RepID=UPI0035933D09
MIQKKSLWIIYKGSTNFPKELTSKSIATEKDLEELIESVKKERAKKKHQSKT